jgi:hypothetical protein
MFIYDCHKMHENARALARNFTRPDLTTLLETWTNYFEKKTSRRTHRKKEVKTK